MRRPLPKRSFAPPEKKAGRDPGGGCQRRDQVAIKWFLHFRSDEAHSERALGILAGVNAGEVELVQPPHFIAEVASVLAREKPDEALSDLSDLLNVEFQTMESSSIYLTATELSIRLGHHLFDTLYHATALHIPGAI